MPIDYSRWKKIEVSDDEDDTHPNIDTPSLFRWRHQARLERMAEKKMKQEEIQKGRNVAQNKKDELVKKLEDVSLDEKVKSDLEKELAELKKQEEDYQKKEKELEDQERLEPWNVDTIGHEAYSASRINKVTDKKPEKPKITEEEDSKRMAKYFEDNEELLQKYGRISSIKASEQFILENPRLSSEYAANWLTIECLNLAIDNRDGEMSNMARQCIILQYLLELAKSLNAEPTNTNIIKNFFKKFQSADPTYMKMYEDEVTQFQDRLRRRAKDKRDQAIAEYESDEKAKRIANAPGGLDPQEVYDSLPDEMKKCFDEQDISMLQKVAETLDQEVFSHHLRRCIDSGLWVPNANGGDEDDSPDQKD
ncbi:unnamed protein product, partial [Mesorhabditis spiculigera]